MARTKRSPRKTAASDEAKFSRTLAANSSTLTLNFQTQETTSHPASDDLVTVFERCRYLKQESDFLKTYLPLKRSILNFGFKLRPARNGKKSTDAEKIAEWMDSQTKVKYEDYTDPQTQEQIEIELVATNREIIGKFVNDFLDDYLLLDNAIAFWTDGNPFAYTLIPEKCQYEDILGVPILRYTHGLSQDQVKLLEPELQEAFAKDTVIVNPALKMHFKLLKRAAVGQGFGLPQLYSIFRLLDECESKQVGMQRMGFTLRRVTRLHKCGHEIKNGDRSGKPIHFLKKERADAIKRLWVNVEGIDDTVVNFDHSVEFPWPDMKFFDGTAFKGSDERLNKWGGPLMQMLYAGGVMPYLTLLLRSEMSEERSVIGPFLTTVINNAFKPPGDIEVAWSNTIFNESRLQSELLKFAYQNGWTSVTTSTEEAGFDPMLEQELKMQEADDPDAEKKFYPMYAAAQALSPAMGETSAAVKAASTAAKGKAPGSVAGKPPGTQDKA